MGLKGNETNGCYYVINCHIHRGTDTNLLAERASSSILSHESSYTPGRFKSEESKILIIFMLSMFGAKLHTGAVVQP